MAINNNFKQWDEVEGWKWDMNFSTMNAEHVTITKQIAIPDIRFCFEKAIYCSNSNPSNEQIYLIRRTIVDVVKVFENEEPFRLDRDLARDYFILHEHRDILHTLSLDYLRKVGRFNALCEVSIRGIAFYQRLKALFFVFDDEVEILTSSKYGIAQLDDDEYHLGRDLMNLQLLFNRTNLLIKKNEFNYDLCREQDNFRVYSNETGIYLEATDDEDSGQVFRTLKELTTAFTVFEFTLTLLPANQQWTHVTRSMVEEISRVPICEIFVTAVEDEDCNLQELDELSRGSTLSEYSLLEEAVDDDDDVCELDRAEGLTCIDSNAKCAMMQDYEEFVEIDIIDEADIKRLEEQEGDIASRGVIIIFQDEIEEVVGGTEGKGNYFSKFRNSARKYFKNILHNT